MTEAQLQRAVFDELKARGKRGLVAWAVPNNPAARRTVGFRAGVHDVHILHDARFFTLELKTEKGRASEEQMEFKDAINNAGGYAWIVYGLKQAIDTLEAWGLLR